MILPKVPKGFITNFPNAVPEFIGPRQFIVLLSVVSIIILTAFFFITSQNLSQKTQSPQYFSFLNQLRQEAGTLQFPSSFVKNRYLENIKAASGESDSEKQLAALSYNFNILSSMYSSTHDPAIREKAQKLGDFVKSAFPNTNEAQFNVSCLDSSCGNLVYAPEEEEILALASEATFKDPKTKEDFFRNMEAANAVEDQNTKWHYYDSVFRIVQMEIKDLKNEDVRLKELGQKILEFIKVKYPEQYSQLKENGYYTLD